MQRVLFLYILSYLGLIPFTLSQVNNNPYNLIGYFDGRTPCQEIAKQLNEPTIPECIKIKWRLTLYKNDGDINSGIFSLEGFKFRGENILKGTWNIIKGTSIDPNAIVYQLKHATRGYLYFLKADDDVLFFLDPGKNILAGNRNFSYALYRAGEN